MSEHDAIITRGRVSDECIAVMDEAFRAIRAQAQATIERSSPKDTAEREAAYFELRALSALQRRLQGYVSEGRLEISTRGGQ